jgi:chromosome segregation ATPase
VPTFTERIENIGAALTDLTNKYNTEAATDDELEAVRVEIFEQIQQLKEEVEALEKTLAIVEDIIAAAQGR